MNGVSEIWTQPREYNLRISLSTLVVSMSNNKKASLNSQFDNKMCSQFCGIPITSRIMNASGVHCTTTEELNELELNEHTFGIITKSCTMNVCDGNQMPRYYYNTELNASINSTGLANLGCEFYMNYKRLTDKPYIISISGKNTKELYKLIDTVTQSDNIKFIEINVSCPNIEGKSQLGYDFQEMKILLEYIKEIKGIENKKIGLKLPAYFDQFHFKEIADLINNSYQICQKPDWITSINSLGNGFMFKNSEEISKESSIKNEYGGIGGSIIKPFALSNIRKFRTLLNKKIHIIGCGGVNSQRDFLEHLEAGADIVQIGTLLYENGPDIFKIFI